MNINKSHLIGLENEMTDHLRDAQQHQIDGLSYGLLPASPDMDKAVDIWMNIDNQNQLTVHLNHCRAITRGGVRIEITKAIADQLRLSANELRSMVQLGKDSSDNLMVVLTADPFNRVPVGDADPEETPPRKPFTLPNYTLSLVPEKEMGPGEFGQYHITIGKISVSHGKAVLEDSYIPASMTVGSHPLLMESWERQMRFLSELERNCVSIIQKIFTKQIKNNLAHIITLICRNLIQYINYQAAYFRQIAQNRPPVYMVTHTASMARVIRNEIDIRQGTGAEQLLNYLSEWCGLNQAGFEKVLDEMIGLNYEHHNIRYSLDEIDRFIDVIAPLFHKLAELDYIGKKSKTNIFVKEETLEQEPNEEKSVWRGRFLAE